MDDQQQDQGFERPLAAKPGCIFHALTVFVALLFCGGLYLAGLWLSFGAGHWGKAAGILSAGLLPGLVSMGVVMGLSVSITGKFERSSAVIGWLCVVVPLLVATVSILPLSLATTAAAALGAGVSTVLVPSVGKRLAMRPKKARSGKPGSWDELFR